MPSAPMAVAATEKYGLPYAADKYDLSACAGLLPDGASCPGLDELKLKRHAACRAMRTSGGVCPAILSCAVKHHGEQAKRADDDSSCTIQRLPGLGFNAAIIRATAKLRRAWPGWPSKAHYISADRFDRHNAKVRCRNPVTHERYPHLMHSATALSFLDRNFSVVKRTFVTGGVCAGGRWTRSLVKTAAMVTDSRPLELGQRELWMSYSSHWKNCNGSWVAQLTNFAQYTCNRGSTGNSLDPLQYMQMLRMKRKLKPPCQGATEHEYRRTASNDGPYVELQPTGSVAGNVVRELEFIAHNRTDRMVAVMQNQSTQSPIALTAMRNGGIIVSNDGGRTPLFELVNVAPQLELRAPDGHYTYHRLPDSFAQKGMHNSIHPLWVPELGAYLGVAHRHYRDGGLSSKEVFRFGSSYRQTLFTLSPVDFSMQRFSRELCFSSLDQGGSACEGVQFVMSAFRPATRSQHTQPSISFSYGVQDCESAVLTITIERLKQLLEFS